MEPSESQFYTDDIFSLPWMKSSTEHMDSSQSTALGKILKGNRAEDSMSFKYKEKNNNEIKKKINHFQQSNNWKGKQQQFHVRQHFLALASTVCLYNWKKECCPELAHYPTEKVLWEC